MEPRDKKQARILFQTQTDDWESLSCKENDDELREFAHDLLDEWLDWMEGQDKGHRQNNNLMYRRLLFQPCDSDHHQPESQEGAGEQSHGAMEDGYE